MRLGYRALIIPQACEEMEYKSVIAFNIILTCVYVMLLKDLLVICLCSFSFINIIIIRRARIPVLGFDSSMKLRPTVFSESQILFRYNLRCAYCYKKFMTLAWLWYVKFTTILCWINYFYDIKYSKITIRQ